MINGRMEYIIQLLISELEKTAQLHVSNYETSESKALFTIDPLNRLSIEVEENGIAVLYSDEHDEFWLKPYKDEDAFIKDVTRFVLDLLQNTVLMEHVYSGDTLLCYKIWIVDKAKKHKRFLKKVTVSPNPLLRLKPKTIQIKRTAFY